MDIKNLARIDLNLLITLQILLEERSVSKTAERLFLTQPAISKSLSRLRDLFNDPLLTRSGRSLVPTPYALGLQDSLKNVLLGVSDLFEPEVFDPASYEGTFKLAVNEFLDMVLLPILVKELSENAPGIHLETYTQMDDQLEGMEKGELDFVLSLSFSEIPPDFTSDLLIRNRPTLFARKGHPLAKKKDIKFEELIPYQRIALNLPDMEKLSVFARRRAFTDESPWKCFFETENLITALAVISSTDFLLPGTGLIKHFSNSDLQFEAIDFDPGPDFIIEYCLVTHERVANSAPHQWLRKKIIELAKKLKN